MWILASASPRRQELLSSLMKSFEVIASHCDEIIDPSWPVQTVAENIACQKALHISNLHPRAFVLGADTIVRLDNTILGKPKDYNHAQDMLELLSDKNHIVETGVCISQGNQIIHQFTEQTEVFFKSLSLIEIQNYIDTKEPFGKAGSYAIQGQGAFLVRKINGCFNNVVGLPIFTLKEILRTEDYERNKQSQSLG